MTLNGSSVIKTIQFLRYKLAISFQNYSAWLQLQFFLIVNWALAALDIQWLWLGFIAP